MMWLIAGAIAFYGYTQGWFASLLPAPTAKSGGTGSSGAAPSSSGSAGAVVPPASVSAPASPSAAPAPPAPNSVTTYSGPSVTPSGAVAASAVAPPLGAMVYNLADVRAQLAANDPYIIPNAWTTKDILSSLPSSYYLVNTKDNGTILVRPDVWWQVSLAIPGATGYTVAGGAAQHTQDGAVISLSDIQGVMKQKGLTGLGDFRRHMYTRTGRVA